MTKQDDEKQVMNVLIQLAEEENRLTETMMGMIGKSNELAANRTASAELRTVLSEERTKLVRDQTKFSRKSTDLAEQRTGMATTRTDLAQERTELARSRTGLSEKRTDLAQERNDLAGDRTILSTYRSILAKGRTDLAIIRTGLASIGLGTALMRYFGLGLWTLLDGSLVVLGALITLFGVKSYVAAKVHERTLDKRIETLISRARPAPEIEAD